uniref:OO_Ba0005L10-OO_Ba0081K17.23 protein n=1 Tax=Oryza officinalis TaxID=4535 RepID=D0ABB4_9ORYZ|nr:OO_Ba0005L10-OO_Ba0081K17.23 [Oryza officinalis]
MLRQPASTSGDVDRTANRRPRHIVPRRSKEKKNPHNIQFERQVAALEYRQEEQRKRANGGRLFFTLSLSSHLVENGDEIEPSSSPSLFLFHFNDPEDLARCLTNSSRALLEDSQQSDKAPDNDFSVNTFSNASVDVKRTTRKKSKKKNKRHKRGHGKKVSEASEIQSMQNKGASHCIDVAGGESLTLSSNHVADAGSEMRCRKETFPSMADGGETLPLTLPPNHVADKLFGDLSSDSSVREVSAERPDSETGNDGSFITLISSTSCSDEIELSRHASYFECCEQSSSNNSRCLDSASTSTLTDSSLDGHYTDSSWNFSDDTENLLIDKNECPPCIQSKVTDLRGFKCGGNEGWLNKANHDKFSCFRNSADACSGTQEMQLYSNAGSDGDFLPVISRKRARRNRKVQPLGSCNVEHICDVEHGQSGKQSNRSSRPSNSCTQVASKNSTKDFINPIKVRTWTPHEVTLNDYMIGANINHLLDPKQNRRGKPHKYSCLSEVANGGFIEEKNAYTAKMLPGIMHSTETGVGQIASSSASDVTVREISEETCTPIGPPVQKGGLQILLREENVAVGTSSLDVLNHVSSVDSEEQKKVDNAVLSRPHGMEGHHLQSQDSGSQFPGCTTDYWKTSRPTESGLEVGCHGVSAFEGHCNMNQQRSVSSKLQLGEMIKAVNDACKVQGSASWQLTISISDIGCLLEKFVGMPKNNLDHKFDSDDDLLLSQPNGACLPKPSLSVQDHGEPLFEYFESEHPSSRPPFFEKIKQLTSGENLSTCQIFGDPKMLENLKLHDLHPASWFCVAWYPICRIPQGNCRAAFLTYHSLGKVVPQIHSPDKADELNHLVSPVVGFWSYNDKGEQWFQLRNPEVKPMSLDVASKTDRAEVLKQRLKTLRHGASVMSSMVIPKANGEKSINRHPDYEFFLSRSN